MGRRLTLLAAVALAGLAFAGPGQAASFTVTNTKNSGPGSLRGAIQAANATSAADTIEFAIPGSGAQTISLSSPLPAIAHPLKIDGRTQPGYAGSPFVELTNGGGAGAIGLDVTAGSSRVLGLSITKFLVGVRLEDGDRNVVVGDWLGLEPSGAPAGNGTGLEIRKGSASNTIGGDNADLRNIVSDDGVGISITGAGTSQNVIVGNCVGLDGNCANAIPNLGDGIRISGGASGNRIGGTTPGTPNVVSANGGAGVDLTGSGTSGNVVVGNDVGTGESDTGLLPNEGGGVRIDTGASANTIGGSAAAERNVIRADSGEVSLAIDGANGNAVRGNTISGGEPIVELSGGAAGNTIGGSGSGAGNTIAGSFGAAVELAGAGTKKNVVAGNQIGDPAGGLAAALVGVEIHAGASQNTIGGTVAGARNLIEGNATDGVRIEGAGTSGNVVAGNRIGEDTGQTGAANGAAGVAIAGGATGNTVGGTAAGALNVIGFNATDGVAIGGAGTSGNVVAGNELFASQNGVSIKAGASKNTVGGTVANARNLFWYDGDGVLLSGSSTTANVVEGNYVGVDVDGISAVGNGNGVELAAGAHGNTVGASNVLGANTNGVLLTGGGTTANAVKGNLIGVGADGTTAVANHEGVEVTAGAHGNTIGGTTAAARNVLSGNADGGVLISGSGTASNTVAGNYIGTDAAGTGAVANDGGVFVVGGATGNTIGGASAGARNVVSGNGTGVLVSDAGSTENSIVGNYVGTDPGGSAALGNSLFGIATAANGTTIRGNVVAGNGGNGIVLEGSRGSVVEGNLVGTSAGGTAFVQNGGDGIALVEGANGNTIGGTTAAARNVVSGNHGTGISLTDSGSNVVEGNYVGTTASGNAGLGNSTGVILFGSSKHNTVGGTSAGARNVLSGNGSQGVFLFGPDVSGNVVEGNYVGTDAAGKKAIPNTFDGVQIFDAFGNVVGGSTAGAGNLVSGNQENGVRIEGDGNVVEGNLIGTNAAGTARIPNAFGVRISRGTGNRIGGTTAATRNVVSGNQGAGVFVEETMTAGTIVEGNYVGLAADGSAKLGNGGGGVVLTSGPANTVVGGEAPGAGNVISANTGDGVAVFGGITNGTRIEGNLIGTDSSGTLDRGNTANGVSFQSGGDRNTVGGTAAADANTIAFNGAAGVVVDGTATATNRDTVERNSIYSNGGLGIGLGGNGNDSIPSPNVESVVTAGTQTKITVGLGASNALFRVEVFVSPTCDPSGAGEGKTFLGAKTVDANQTSSTTLTVDVLPAGQKVTATETDLNDGDTSQFSACFTTP